MGQSLSVKLLALLTIALLPLGLIAVYQTLSVISEADKLSRREMLARTMDAARAEIRVISEAYGAAYALGTTAVQVGSATPICSETMRTFVDNDPRFVFSGFIDRDGIMRCFSTGDVTDFSGWDMWKDFVSSPRPTIVINRQGASSGLSVLIATTPIYGVDKELLGAASVSIPHSLLDVLLMNEIEALDVALVDRDGTVLSASTGIDASVAFDGLAGQFRADDVPPEGTILDGAGMSEATAFAVVPLALSDVFIVGKWATETHQRSVSFLGTTAPLFPVIMWVASLFVAVYALQHFVLRHLKVLRERMRRFSIDDLETSYVRLKNAPSELSEIGDSYNALLDQIKIDTEELAENVREKELLLKEVHHRVKNNLQLIASILNMQLRQITSPDAQSVLRRVQERVMSLATIHKLLYSDNKVDVVRVDVLLSEILQSTMKVGAPGKGGPKSTYELRPMELDPDQAVPLALLTTEAVTNALKYVGAADGTAGTIAVKLSETDDGQIKLNIENSIGEKATSPETEDGTGLGSRLIQAFVSQLDGHSEVEKTATTFALRVSFPKWPEASTIAEAA